MKKDSLYGPPKDIMDEAPVKKPKRKNDVQEDPDEFMSDEEKDKLGFNLD